LTYKTPSEQQKENIQVIRDYIASKHPDLIEHFKDDENIINWAIAMMANRIKRGKL